MSSRGRPLPVGSGLRISVPASTANLGSGFDALGMALSLHDTVEVDVVDGPSGAARVSAEGENAGAVPSDERHLVVRALHGTMAALGVDPPALELRCANAIPHSRGLGSSAAAIVAGVVAGHELAGLSPLDGRLSSRDGRFSAQGGENLDRALDLAAAREGHADNVAASLLGGLVIAWEESGRFRASRLEPDARVRPVALVPFAESSTHTTRGLLPEQVPHSDATFAAGRAALAVHALTSAPELLLAATDDRLHQDYREPAWPETVSLVRRLRAAEVPAAVSGAGPTVLALPAAGELPSGVDVSGFDVRDLPVDGDGVRVEVSEG